MLRLDHNRALSQLANKAGVAVGDIEKLVVWGNHSPTMYPDYRFATVNGASLKDKISDADWNANTFIPQVGKRGAAIIEARGLSSAASAANAAIDHIRDWVLGSNGKWVTMGVPSDGSYGIPEGVMYGVPVITANGEYTRVEGLPVDEFSRAAMDKTLAELEEERAGVAHLLDLRSTGGAGCHLRRPPQWRASFDPGQEKGRGAVTSRVAVLIPCFNEEAAIGKVVRDFRAALPGARIYVYDNNTTDRTVERAARPAPSCVGAPQGQGQRRAPRVRRHRRRHLPDGRRRRHLRRRRSRRSWSSGSIDENSTGRRRASQATPTGPATRPATRPADRLVAGMFGDTIGDMLSGYRVVLAAAS